MKIVSWNVNGIRACAKKGFLSWLEEASPDVSCFRRPRLGPINSTLSCSSRTAITASGQPRKRRGIQGLDLVAPSA